MKTLRVNDLDMAFVDQGSGPIVLAVHGFPLSHAMWQSQIDALSDQFRVIVPDLRGCGASHFEFDHPKTASLTMETHADDLAALLDALGIDEPVTFCGLSMGGYIAWQFFRRHRAKLGRLILCDTRSAADSDDARKQRHLMATGALTFGSKVAASVMIPKMFWKGSLQRDPQIAEPTREVVRATPPATIAAALRGMAQRSDSADLLPTIDVPTLLLGGEHDEISTPEEMQGIAAAIPGAKFVLVPDAGHMAPIENPTVVNDAIRDFLS
jgi:pimeloyl-ACP methyl ester carboxylesterase